MKKIIKIFLFILLLSILGLIGLQTAVHFGLTNKKSNVDPKSQELQATTTAVFNNMFWKDSEEWALYKTAVVKDSQKINTAAQISGVNPRLIFSVVAVEQLRLFFTQRGLFKDIFKKFNVLAVQSQFSWGVAGVKQDTAIQVEQNLKATTSPFYLGTSSEHLLDFKNKDGSINTVNADTLRFNRLVDEKDNSYSYLYAGLILRQITSQWNKAGFDISNNPGVLGTLYNIGFKNSKPKSAPDIGGAEIDIGGTIYTFGGLVHDIYYSDELTEVFPK